MKWLQNEYRFFLACPRNMRILLLTNMIFAFILPVIEVFVSAYIMRNSNAASKVASYQLAIYTGTPLAFFINGLLLDKLGVKHLYICGIMLSGISLVILMSSNLTTMLGIAICGLLMGVATGLFWANRGLLALITTNDENRNYYYGLEMFCYTIASVLVPAFTGWFIAGTTKYAWFGNTANEAYRVIAIAACVFAAFASYVIRKGNFSRAPQPKFIFFRFHPAWRRMLVLAVLFGLGQGYLVTAPALLVLMLVGKEGTLGAILACGGVVSALVLYTIGRITKPRHRVAVLGTGIMIFLAGSLVNTILFNARAVLIFMVCLVIAKPALEWAYFPIQMSVIDAVSPIEQRNQYAYIFNHEFGLYIGRLLGGVSFLFLAIYISDVVALRVALPVIALIQLLSIPLAKRILASNRELEAEARQRLRRSEIVTAGL